MSTPEPGDRAPEIALRDDAGTVHRLSEQHGRWIVVFFYPEDDTPGCTVESCQFRDADPQFRDASARIWGISPDGAASHARFREKFNLPFTLLSDEDHAVAEAYGAWRLKSLYGREFMGIQRSTFLVDPDGVIARTWPKVKADGHAAEVLTALEDARSARAAS
ncbi:MAG: peroxiredoxin [Chloroflexota bacterium]